MIKPKLPESKLNELIGYAETELQFGGTLNQMVNKIENIAWGNGYRVNRQEVKARLVEACSKEVQQELFRVLQGTQHIQ